MKLETTVILTKGICSVLEGVCLGITAGLAQWATGGDSPSKIAWAVIIASSILNGAAKLQAFLSSSFANYRAKAEQNPNPPPNETTETKI